MLNQKTALGDPSWSSLQILSPLWIYAVSCFTSLFVSLEILEFSSVFQLIPAELQDSANHLICVCDEWQCRTRDWRTSSRCWSPRTGPFGQRPLQRSAGTPSTMKISYRSGNQSTHSGTDSLCRFQSLLKSLGSPSWDVRISTGAALHSILSVIRANSTPTTTSSSKVDKTVESIAAGLQQFDSFSVLRSFRPLLRYYYYLENCKCRKV